MNERYPDWIWKLLVNNGLPWNKAFTNTFEEFGKIFTLHDSYWVKLEYNVAYDDTAILVIDWDKVWFPSFIKQQLNPGVDLVLLFIKLYKVRQISTSGFQNWKEPFLIQRGIEGHEIEIIDQEHLLIVSDFYGGFVEIIFSGQASFLAITQDQLFVTLDKN